MNRVQQGSPTRTAKRGLLMQSTGRSLLLLRPTSPPSTLRVDRRDLTEAMGELNQLAPHAPVGLVQRCSRAASVRRCCAPAAPLAGNVPDQRTHPSHEFVICLHHLVEVFDTRSGGEKTRC